VFYFIRSLEKKEKEPETINLGHQFIKERERERGGGKKRRREGGRERDCKKSAKSFMYFNP